MHKQAKHVRASPDRGGASRGNSINATVRMTGVSKPTILKLIHDLGGACAKLHDEKVRGLKPPRIQCDEIWAFVYSKQKRVAGAKAAPAGAGRWRLLDPDRA